MDKSGMKTHIWVLHQTIAERKASKKRFIEAIKEYEKEVIEIKNLITTYALEIEMLEEYRDWRIKKIKEKDNE